MHLDENKSHEILIKTTVYFTSLAVLIALCTQISVLNIVDVCLIKYLSQLAFFMPNFPG